jgi:hypothetical protein
MLSEQVKTRSPNILEEQVLFNKFCGEGYLSSIKGLKRSLFFSYIVDTTQSLSGIKQNGFFDRQGIKTESWYINTIGENSKVYVNFLSLWYKRILIILFIYNIVNNSKINKLNTYFQNLSYIYIYIPERLNFRRLE